MDLSESWWWLPRRRRRRCPRAAPAVLTAAERRCVVAVFARRKTSLLRCRAAGVDVPGTWKWKPGTEVDVDDKAGRPAGAAAAPVLLWERQGHASRCPPVRRR